MQQIQQYARQNRRNPTEPELRLWRHLSHSRLGGFKFRRQHAIGGHILDFFWPTIALALEVDGHTHDPDEDRVRDTALLGAGITTLRVSNSDVMTNMKGVLLTIISVAESLPRRWMSPS